MISTPSPLLMGRPRIMKNKNGKARSKEAKLQLQKAIGANIRRVRTSARTFLSAEKVAGKLGISRVTLTQIENGKKGISADLLWELSCLFGCEIQDLYPTVPAGYQLSERDIKEIRRVDPKAVSFAELAFGKPVTKEDD